MINSFNANRKMYSYIGLHTTIEKNSIFGCFPSKDMQTPPSTPQKWPS